MEQTSSNTTHKQIVGDAKLNHRVERLTTESEENVQLQISVTCYRARKQYLLRLSHGTRESIQEEALLALGLVQVVAEN